MSASSTGKNFTRKAMDPMFLCMLGAILLAVGSSVMLRVVAGPRPAEASVITVIPAPPPPHPRANSSSQN